MTSPKENYKEWKEIHQPWELKYHQRRNFRWPGREHVWDEQWDNVFSLFAGMKKDQFNDSHTLIDIGCGSRPALQWFNSGKIYNIDPLLDDYLKIEPLSHFWSSYDQSQLISRPAEEFQPNLENKADFVLSWNVLDHTYDYKTIISNCAKYCKKNSLFLLGADVGGNPHIGHPGIKNRTEFLDSLSNHFDILKHSIRGFKRLRTDSVILRRK